MLSRAEKLPNINYVHLSHQRRRDTLMIYAPDLAVLLPNHVDGCPIVLRNKIGYLILHAVEAAVLDVLDAQG